MANDKWIGLIMAILAAAGIIAEFLLIFAPLWNDNIEGGTAGAFTGTAQYWALAIPLFLGVFGVLAIVLWIGLTMYQTPPPEAWDFEDLEDEFDEFDEEEEKKESKPAKKADKATGGEDLTTIDGVSESIAESLAEAGYDTKAKIAAADVADLTKIKGIGKVTAQKIIDGAQ